MCSTSSLIYDECVGGGQPVQQVGDAVRGELLEGDRAAGPAGREHPLQER